MKDGVANQDTLLDEDLIDESFDAALEEVKKSLNSEGNDLLKAGKDYPMKGKGPEGDEDEGKGPEGDEDEGKGEEDEPMKKSIEEILEDDPEAAAAMDIEPFLRAFAKAMDEAVSEVFDRVVATEKLVKSQAELMTVTAQLQKSTRDMVKVIGGQPVPSNSIKTLAKSRFGEGEGSKEMDNMEILAKSREWSSKKQISLLEAGMIEGRINQGTLGKRGDALDQKVANLIEKEGK